VYAWALIGSGKGDGLLRKRGQGGVAPWIALVVGCVTLTLATAVPAVPALAATQRSRNVAIVLGEGTESAGTLPTGGAVAGDEADSFEEFSFTDLTQEQIQTSILSSYDTVVLNQVFTQSLTEAQKQAISSFVTSGGKLIIHDADGTEGNSYTWLPVPAESGVSCENCGNLGGEATIVENNTIVSNEPASPSYINVDELPGNSDAVGDANLLVSNDPRWDVDIFATNGLGVKGAVDAYAEDGGLILYNGFDTDDIESTFGSGVGWLQKIWYDELNQQWDPDNLPHKTPLIGESGHCGHESLTVGVVLICAEHIQGTSSETTASGNVVLDGALSVGNGPVAINQETKQISMATPAPIALLRSEGPASLGSASLAIDASGTTDPVSGKANLAKLTLTGASLGALGDLRVGGLPFALPSGASLSLYLDSEMGGGLITAGSLELPIDKLQATGAVSLGFYVHGPRPVIALGGAVSLGSIQLGSDWKFDGLSLSYQEPTDTWAVSGGLEAPIGSLEASGSVVSGRLESLHVDIGGQNVPLGDTGFFFSDFGGGFTGLANGPLQIDASTAGYWGVPKAPFEPFYLDNVTLTVNFGGSVSLDGAVSLALREHSPVHGEIHLRLGLSPFSATGRFSVEGSLPGVSMKAGGGAGFTTKHFTAVENGSISVFGLEGKGEVIASDKGLGASGSICGPFHIFCQTVALAGTWDQIGKFDVPAIIGGEPRRLITVGGVSAAGSSESVRVPPRRRLLLIAVSTPSGEKVKLYAPSGKSYTGSKRSRSVVFKRQSRFGLTTIAVLYPQAGRWRILTMGGGHPQIEAQTLGFLTLINAAQIAPASSSHHRLAGGQRILVRWSSSHLPPGVKVTLVVRANRQAARAIAEGLRPSGKYSIAVRKLPIGRSEIALQATLNGVPFQQMAVPGQVWRAPPPRHTRKHRGRSRRR
jgi:hypothetical protein